MVQTLPLLQAHPIFAKASPGNLDVLAKVSAVRTYDKNSPVAVLLAPQTHVLLITSGSINLYRRNRENKNQILVGQIHAPSLFGDAEAYSASKRWVVSARAAESTVAVAIPNTTFDAFIEREGKVAAALYRDACARHLLSIEITEIFGLQKTQNKILRLLIGKTPGRAINQNRLAAALGINRRTVARTLEELERQGVLVLHDGQYEVSPSNPVFPNLRAGLGGTWQL